MQEEHLELEMGLDEEKIRNTIISWVTVVTQLAKRQVDETNQIHLTGSIWVEIFPTEIELVQFIREACPRADAKKTRLAKKAGCCIVSQLCQHTANLLTEPTTDHSDIAQLLRILKREIQAETFDSLLP